MGQKATAEDLRQLLRVAHNLRATASDMIERVYADKLIGAAEALEGRAHFLADHPEDLDVSPHAPTRARIDIRC